MGNWRINDSMKASKRSFNESMTNDRVNKTDYIANKLVKTYNAPQSRNFFLKCAWHLSEDEIWSTVENSQRKGIECPIKYFVACCHKAMQSR